ncbi:MAG: hypothetical protein ACJ74O_17950 [Frankiaceae bacterium]
MSEVEAGRELTGTPPSGAGTPRQPLSRRERFVAASIGVACAGAGGVAVFVSDNELGSAGLLIVGAVFLLMGTGAMVPTRLRVGDQEVHLERLAVQTLTRVMQQGDTVVQEQLVEAFEETLASSGVVPDAMEAVGAMLRRFERYSGSTDPREVYNSLLTSGWKPTTPAKSTYIRWVYAGNQRTVSLFQNSAALVAASVHLRDLAAGLPGAKPRAGRNEVDFYYGGDVSTVLDAAERIKQFADRP